MPAEIDAPIVIVGAGHVGGRVALRLSQLLYQELLPVCIAAGHCESAVLAAIPQIILLGEESDPPYERPSLSKQFLTTDAPPTYLWGSAKAIPPRGVTWRGNSRVTALKAEDKTITYLGVNAGDSLSSLPSSTKIELRYSTLVLAQGGTPRRLSLPKEIDQAKFVYLRSINDATQLRQGLLEKVIDQTVAAPPHLLVIGAGFIGLEIAAAAVTMGWQVTVVEAAGRVLGRGVGKMLADGVHDFFITRGVEVFLNAQLQNWQTKPTGQNKRDVRISVDVTSDGKCQTREYDWVIVGIGLIPNTQLALDAGLSVDKGAVRVDFFLQTAHPDIFAGGDMVTFPSSSVDEAGASSHLPHLIRRESWQNAEDHAQTLAHNLGARVVSQIKKRFELADNAVIAAAATPCPLVSRVWFWSDLFEQTVQVLGVVPTDLAPSVVRRTTSGTLYFYWRKWLPSSPVLADDSTLGNLYALEFFGSGSKEWKLASRLYEQKIQVSRDELAHGDFKKLLTRGTA